MFYSAFRSVYKNNIIFKLYPCGGNLERSTDINVDVNAKFLSSKKLSYRFCDLIGLTLYHILIYLESMFYNHFWLIGEVRSKQHRRDINNDGSRYFEFGLYPFVLDKHQYSVLQTMYS